VALPPQKPGRVDPSAERDPVADKLASAELADQCGDLEEELERLRHRYEMFFLGVERREPNRERDDLKRRIERIKNAFTRNTGLKFRLQTLAARYLSYERMWVRSAREKEEGTYRRDLFKARRHAKERRAQSESSASLEPRAQAGEGPPADPPAGEVPSAEVPPGSAVAEPAAEPPVRAAGLAPEPPPRPLAPPAGPAGIGEAQRRALYDAYVDAKKRCNEDVSRLSFEAFSRSVQKQVPELITRYKARSVEFKVVIQGGKALLKAVPRS
jgi:hypothetical protein